MFQISELLSLALRKRYLALTAYLPFEKQRGLVSQCFEGLKCYCGLARERYFFFIIQSEFLMPIMIFNEMNC